MAKPIFIIKVPSYVSTEEFKEINLHVRNELTDYHVLMVSDDTIKCFDFKVFSDKKIKPIELDKLKSVLNIK